MRSTKQFGVGVFCFIVGVGTGGLIITHASPTQTATAKTIRTENLQIVDKAGRVRADFGMRIDGTPAIRMFDNSGKGVALFAVINNAPMIQLEGKSGQPRLSIAVFKGDSPSIMLYGNNPNESLGIDLFNGENPDITFTNSKGKQQLSIYSLSAGLSGIDINNPIGVTSLRFAVGKTGWAEISAPTMDGKLFDLIPGGGEADGKK